MLSHPLPPLPTPLALPPKGLYRLRGVFVDWYQVRSRESASYLRDVVAEGFVNDGLSCPVEWHREAGRGGFANWDVATMGGMRLGHVAWGGKHVADWSHFVLTGEGCGMVGDWTAFDAFVRAQAPCVQHRRVDLAADVFDGSMDYEYAEAAWELGGYDPARGPRPKRDRKGYPESGRTFYAGTRATSDRFLRLYEKGLQMGYHPWGEGHDPRMWFRLEVENKPANGPIPLDIIAAREAFFVGAAPILAHLWVGVEGRRAPRDPLNDIAAEVSEAVRHLRRSAGPSLKVLLDVYGGPQALIEALTAGVNPSERLVQAGAAILDRSDLAKFGV